MKRRIYPSRSFRLCPQDDNDALNNGISFLQSEQWEKFQKAVGRKVWRVDGTLVIRHSLPLGKNYLYCPRGPIGSLSEFLEATKPLAEKEKSIFLKIEPEAGFSQNLGAFQKSAKEIQPSETIVLDISKPEEEISSQMKPKTRYNLRLAEKKGVEIETGGGSESLKKFLKLAEKTAKRDGFHLHPRHYYQKMIEVLGKDGLAKLYLAKYKNKVIAADLIVFFDQTATYLHGASDYGHRQLMAPYLLKWREIRDAREMGLRYFDFYGINEKKWPGVTRFKQGFGGQEITYPGAYDLAFSSFWYQAYNLARKFF